MRALGVLLVCFSLAYSQTKPKEKPTPEQRARELMDKAVETVTAAGIETQASALLHLAEVYPDKQQALELFERAYSSASTLSGSNKTEMQIHIISVLAEYDLDRATDLLRQLPPSTSKSDFDPRNQPVNRIVGQLIQKKQLDKAIDLVTIVGTGSVFSFGAAQQIAKALSEDDPRRPQLFASASAAYSQRPYGRFSDYIAQEWKYVPQQMADTAIQRLLGAILEKKDGARENFVQTISSSKGAVSFTNRADPELFRVMHIVERINPKKAAELLETRPELREALSKFPEGPASMKSSEGDGLSTNTTSGSGDELTAEQLAEMRNRSISESKLQQAMATMSTDSDKGMALIAEIPLVDMRIEALGAAARQAAAKDPSTGKAALTKCVQMLDEAKTAPVEVWLDVAEAAHHLKDEERAKSAFDRALSVALERYKDDTNGENPNLALREFWPSTQSTRRIVNRAVRLYGLDAEYILPRITDPDLNTIATVEMARSLVKKPARAGSTSVNRPAKKK